MTYHIGRKPSKLDWNAATIAKYPNQIILSKLLLFSIQVGWADRQAGGKQWRAGRVDFSKSYFSKLFWCQKYVSMEELIMMKSTLFLFYYLFKKQNEA